jgi:hypothetical protein
MAKHETFKHGPWAIVMSRPENPKRFYFIGSRANRTLARKDCKARIAGAPAGWYKFRVVKYSDWAEGKYQ